eukprot:gene11046-14831_t
MNNFPYHVKSNRIVPPYTSGYNINNIKDKNFTNQSDSFGSSTPTSYMVVSFPDSDIALDNRFDEKANEFPRLKVAEEKKREVQIKSKNKPPMPTNSLSSSFSLPKAIPNREETRNMIGRADQDIQTNMPNMSRLKIGGLEYASWSSDVVDPFLKDLKKAIKNNRPADINAFCIQYCQALAEGKPPPDTVETA